MPGEHGEAPSPQSESEPPARRNAFADSRYAVRRRARLEAEARLLKMSLNDGEAMLTRIAAQSRKWFRRRRILDATSALCAAAFVAVLVCAWLASGWPADVWIRAILVVVGVVYLVSYPITRWLLNYQSAMLLSRLDDMRALAPLIDALSLQDPDTRGYATAGLMRLLPRVQPRDGDLLTEAHYARLRRVLMSRDKLLIIATLNAYEQIGRDEDIVVVSELAAGHYKAGKDSRVQAAAEACKEVLMIRREQQLPSRTLVRPATADDGAETLARPAHGASTDEALLLRPRAGDETE